MTDTAEVKTRNMETHSALPPEETERLGGEIVAALKTVFDPEIPADIYELGLIYKVDIKDDRSGGAAHYRADQTRRFRDRGLAGRHQERRLRRAILYGRVRPRDSPDRRGRRGQGREDPGRSQGRAVPAGHRDGLQGRQDVGAVHLQQPEPDRGLRLRRIRAADGREGLDVPSHFAAIPRSAS